MPPKKRTLLGEFERTVASSQSINPELDAAAVQAGRELAEQIDFAKANLSGSDLTKALYLMPHLMAVLEKLLATPKARQDAKPTSTGSTSKVTEMRSALGRRPA